MKQQTNNKKRVREINKFLREMDSFIENQKVIELEEMDKSWQEPYLKIKEYTEISDYYY